MSLIIATAVEVLAGASDESRKKAARQLAERLVWLILVAQGLGEPTRGN